MSHFVHNFHQILLLCSDKFVKLCAILRLKGKIKCFLLSSSASLSWSSSSSSSSAPVKVIITGLLDLHGSFGLYFSAKGRTNLELREKFIVPEGTTQIMASFRYRGRRSRPSSRGASPNRSMSSQSCLIPINLTATGTPKVRRLCMLLEPVSALLFAPTVPHFHLILFFILIILSFLYISILCFV